jgi:hypothetical protein
LLAPSTVIVVQTLVFQDWRGEGAIWDDGGSLVVEDIRRRLREGGRRRFYERGKPMHCRWNEGTHEELKRNERVA